MVNPIAAGGTGTVESPRVATLRVVKPATHDTQSREVSSDATPAARLAALGPPIDINRVNEIRQAIASGNYTVDADRLAAAMIALDLPESGQ